MKIEVYTDHNIRGTNNLIVQVKNIFQDKLDYYSNDLTRVIVSFIDINAKKGGFQDKKCTIEARVQNMKPVAVHSTTSELILSLDNACDKMNHLLRTVIEKRRSHRSNIYAIDLLIQEKISVDNYNDEENRLN